METDKDTTAQSMLKELLYKQLDTHSVLSRKGVEFHPKSINDDNEPLQGKHILSQFVASNLEKETNMEKLHDEIKEKRCEIDIESVDVKKLLRYPGGVSKLAHLAVQGDISKRKSLSQRDQYTSSPIPIPLVPIPGVSQQYTSSIPLLPEEVILRHKLTLAEIRSLPRFGKYDSGTPSNILYIKNLHDRVSENDLMSVFGRYCVDNGKGVNIRLMKTGRMRGQAFIEFQTVSIATEALELANGYHMYDKPLIISYGKKGHGNDGMDTS